MPRELNLKTPPEREQQSLRARLRQGVIERNDPHHLPPRPNEVRSAIPHRNATRNHTSELEKGCNTTRMCTTRTTPS